MPAPFSFSCGALLRETFNETAVNHRRADRDPRHINNRSRCLSITSNDETQV
jgi:hypothetical protein